MGKKSTKLLGYLVIVHLVMSMWMMGCEEIFVGEPNSDNDPYSTTFEEVGQTSFLDKLSKKHLVPLKVTLVMFIIGQLLSNISSAFLRRIFGCLRCLTCARSSKVKHLTSSMNTVQVDYSSARDREIIKGLATYNILQNPKYQEAFAITPEFAATHNKVRSGEDTEVNKEKGCSSLAKHSRNKIVMSNTRAGAKVEYFREKPLLHYSILT
eukprot:scaffold153312_cov24-Cyclotella_meneghiniana.AAC.1